MIDDFFAFVDQLFPLFAFGAGVVIALDIVVAVIRIVRSLLSDSEY